MYTQISLQYLAVLSKCVSLQTPHTRSEDPHSGCITRLTHRFHFTESQLQRLKRQVIAQDLSFKQFLEYHTLIRWVIVQDLSVQQFVERFERPRLPVVISGLCDSWMGHEKWTEENLVKHYGEHKFKVCHARPGHSASAFYAWNHLPLYAHSLQEGLDAKLIKLSAAAWLQCKTSEVLLALHVVEIHTCTVCSQPKVSSTQRSVKGLQVATQGRS